MWGYVFLPIGFGGMYAPHKITLFKVKSELYHG